jgi:RNA polymerase sigma-54 factor
MAIELKQSLKLSQQLLITPQLQQAIKLLQLSRTELVETVQKELMENPVLEEGISPEHIEVENTVATERLSDLNTASDASGGGEGLLATLWIIMSTMADAVGREMHSQRGRPAKRAASC